MGGLLYFNLNAQSEGDAWSEKVWRDADNAVKEHFSTWIYKSLQRCEGMNKVWCWHIFLVWKLVFIDSYLKSCHYYENSSNPFLFKHFQLGLLVIPCSSQSGESLKWLKCDSLGVRKTKHRVVCVFIICSHVLYSVYYKQCPYTQPHVPTPNSSPQPFNHTSDSFPFLFPSLHPSSSVLFHRHKPMFCFVFSPLCF